MSYETGQWWRHALAWAVEVALLGGAVLLVVDADRTPALVGAAGLWTVILAVDGLVTAYDVARLCRQPDVAASDASELGRWVGADAGRANQQ